MQLPQTQLGQLKPAGSSPTLPRRPRIALYSHDTMGMGHLRRNLLIAGSLTTAPLNAETLVISGAREASYFSEQAGLDCVTLPSLRKDLSGHYSARNFDWSLEQILYCRSRIISTAIECFQPDVFIVDKVPRGIGNELEPVLKQLRETGNTHCVLGLRDILDDPKTAQQEWSSLDCDEAVSNYYDNVWIYGDSTVFNSVAEYNFLQQMTDKVRFTGFLDQSKRLSEKRQEIPDESCENDIPMALCAVGGGQDGYELAAAFLRDGVPSGWRGVVITGPCMPQSEQRELSRLAGSQPQIQVIDHLVETDLLLSKATRVVTMGGYNSVTSVLSFGKPALIVPRVKPRQEKLIRAQRLQQLGWTSVLNPDQLQLGAIRRWLETSHVPTPDTARINLNGLQNINMQLRSVLHRIPRSIDADRYGITS